MHESPQASSPEAARLRWATAAVLYDELQGLLASAKASDDPSLVENTRVLAEALEARACAQV